MTKECECAAHSAAECVCGAWDEPQRQWIGLSDEEVRQMCGSVPSMREAVREAEAKLKEKNK